MQFEKHNTLFSEISKKIYLAADKLAKNQISQDEIYKLLSRPPKANMGDLAFPCFPLAKTLKSAPPQIANTLKENIDSLASPLIEEVKVFGPYINFFLKEDEVNKVILSDILNGTMFSKTLTKDAPKSIVEFSQPNTHKIMHVGHMRNLCLGDAIVKLYRYAGIPTLSTTFPGDVGTHVAKCLWYLKKHNKEEAPTQRKGAWLGGMYTLGNNLLDEQKGTPAEDENRKELTEILKQLHAGSGEYYDLWKETRQWSIDLMKNVYAWANVEFDSWYWESDVDADSVALVKEYYEKGLFVKDDGAIGIDLSDDKLGFCLLLKTDGTGLYATKDLELARRKFIDHKVEKSLYVVDNRQALHFKQVFKTLEKMGFEQAKDCVHLQYEMVELTDGAMSSRKGNIVALQDLIDQMINTIKKEHLQKYMGSWSNEKIEEVANQVAKGAIKFGMTRVDSNKKIIFDMNEWLKLDGESGPYIQYVYARIQSLLAKLPTREKLAHLSELKHPLEKEIILKLSLFNNIIESSVSQVKTHNLCGYLYELAKAYNSFYAECSVVNAESDALKYARADLTDAVAITLKQGLALLGIDSPEQM